MPRVPTSRVDWRDDKVGSPGTKENIATRPGDALSVRRPFALLAAWQVTAMVVSCLGKLQQRTAATRPPIPTVTLTAGFQAISMALAKKCDMRRAAEIELTAADRVSSHFLTMVARCAIGHNKGERW